MKTKHLLPLKYTALIVIGSIIVSCELNQSENDYLPNREKAGGETTIFMNNSQAFGTPSPNLSANGLEKHLDGDVAFENSFVSHPSGLFGGLGPVFNNNSCIACHPRDGRTAPPKNMDDLSGMFLRISMLGKNENGGPKPVPGFGTQLQHQSVYGVENEARFTVRYEAIERTYGDRKKITLKKPIYEIVDSYIPLPDGIQHSPRNAPPVFGLGLLEAISENDILALADEHDFNKDGISGKANYVWDPVSASVQLGRFGWKAGTSSLLVQTAGAYNEDMGITNSIFANESSFGQTNSETEFNNLEVSDKDLHDVSFYVSTLGVPAARKVNDPTIQQGLDLFNKINCTSCHTPQFTTASFSEIPELGKQKIYPFSDMLLHDMGPDLADGVTEFYAEGNEWKTRPLWGIGLTQVVNGHSNFLHDGRARTIEEAILWHGGEAEESRNKFMQLSENERNTVLLFIHSL